MGYPPKYPLLHDCLSCLVSVFSGSTFLAGNNSPEILTSIKFTYICRTICEENFKLNTLTLKLIKSLSGGCSNSTKKMNKGQATKVHYISTDHVFTGHILRLVRNESSRMRNKRQLTLKITAQDVFCADFALASGKQRAAK